MVRCVEQEREKEDEASVPEEKNTLYLLYQRQSELFWGKRKVRLLASVRLREKEVSNSS